MLRNTLSALRRATALQACLASEGLAAAASGGLPAFAAAMQRAAAQQPSWAAAAQLPSCRRFAAAAAAGGGGGGGGKQPPAAGDGGEGYEADEDEEGTGAPMVLASESGRLQFGDVEEALEAWGKAMDEGAAGGQRRWWRRR